MVAALLHLFPGIEDMFFVKWLFTALFMTMRYAFFAGGLFLLFYVWKRKDWFYRKVQQKFPEKKRIVHEVRYSLSSFVIFSLMATLMGLLVKAGHTKIYLDFSEHSIWYFLGSTVLLIIIHDTYFYWTHRAMHHPKLFKTVHKVHHMSNDPTPWAAFSFHPIEAVVEFGFLPILVVLMPLHPIAIALFSLYSILLNVMGHLGFEVLPSGFTKHKVFKWFNTTTHHNMHHKMVKCNYGLYYNFWDRIMKTNHAKYDETFEAIHSRPRPEKEKDAQQNLAHSPA